MYRFGDLVAIKFGGGRKLASLFLGPYEVTNIKSIRRYDERKAADAEDPNATSTSNNMKLWRYVAENKNFLSSDRMMIRMAECKVVTSYTLECTIWYGWRL